MVKDKKLIQNFGHKILQIGFTAIPNLLLENQTELGLNDNEMLFFIKCYMIHSKKYIKNKDLNMACSGRTIQRIKKSLNEKDYLKSNELYMKDKKGKIIGIGTSYDWAGLITALGNIRIGQDDAKKPSDKTECQSNEQLDLLGNETADTTTTKERIVNEPIVKEKTNYKPFEDKYIELFKTKCDKPIRYEFQINRKLTKPLIDEYPMDTLLKLLDIWFNDSWGKTTGYSIRNFRQDFNRLLMKIGDGTPNEIPSGYTEQKDG